MLCGAIARTPLGTSHVGVESGHQSSTARSAKAHLGSKGHSLLSLQTTRTLDGIRTGQKSMVGTFWLFLQLLHGLHEAICKYGFVNIVSFGSPPAPKMGPPHGVQALTLTCGSQTGDCKFFLVADGSFGKHILPIEVLTCTSDCTLGRRIAGQIRFVESCDELGVEFCLYTSQETWPSISTLG